MIINIKMSHFTKHVTLDEEFVSTHVDGLAYTLRF